MKKKILETFDLKFNSHKEAYFWLSTFWLFVASIASTCLIWHLKENSVRLIENLYKIDPLIFIIVGLVLLFILIRLFIFFVNPKEQFDKQRIHNQPSWVFYAYWSFINSFLLCSGYSKLENENRYWILLLPPLIILVIKFIYELKTKGKDLTFTRFASGSVGLKNDAFDFKTTAQNTVSGLLDLKSYVNIVGLYGDLGYGKSSYARMILESFNSKEILYTYISLTETNQAKDFSGLFAERWLETLSERYPKIDITSYLPFMDPILRESGNGIFSDILKAISALNTGLNKTKAKFYDDNYSIKNKNAETRVAKLFGNITEIKEKLWIILIDEIERGQLDEIYRVIEIVERFKNEGRSGLPIKLLFLFCISESDLYSYLNSFIEKDARARLLKTFFYEDPKSISQKIFLPPVKPDIKEKYVVDQFDTIIKRENIKHQGDVNPNTILHPSRSFLKDKDALDYILYKLVESSPRIINRIVSALDFFYGSFKNSAGEADKNAIRFSDIIALEYIKIKYPYLIDFFTKTIHVLVNQTERHNMTAYLVKEDLKEKKMDLIGWIESVTERKFSEEEKSEILEMIGLVMYYYFDFLNKDYDTKNKDQYFDSTSYPEKMYDYLSLVSEGIETNYRKYNQIYQKHQNNSKLILGLENDELVGYARFLYDIPSADVQLNIDVLDELTKRIVNKRIKPDPLNISDSSYDEALYQFIFQIVVVTEKEREEETPTPNIQKSFVYLKRVLQSKINIGAKYIILNSLSNTERGAGSTVHFRLVGSFQKLSKYFPEEIKSIIKNVFTDAEKRYFGEKARGFIYKSEENFFFLLYQSWSGSKDNTEEINRIRNTAKRGLRSYPKAIKIYWDRYPFNEGWKSYKDVIENDRFSLTDKNNDLYMPLETLIKITKLSKIKDENILKKMKFWSQIKDSPEIKQRTILQDDDSTLKSFLTKAGYL